MKNKKIVMSGICMSLAGAVVLLSQTIGVQTSKILVPVFFILGSYFAYKFSREIKGHNVGRQFYLLQALGMLVFGILIVVIADSLESFLNFVTYFVMCFGILEFSFVLMSFNIGLTIRWNIIIYRIVSGFSAMIGAMILLFITMTDSMQGLIIAGTLMLINGLAFGVFAQKLESKS